MEGVSNEHCQMEYSFPLLRKNSLEQHISFLYLMNDNLSYDAYF